MEKPASTLEQSNPVPWASRFRGSDIFRPMTVRSTFSYLQDGLALVLLQKMVKMAGSKESMLSQVEKGAYTRAVGGCSPRSNLSCFDR